MDQHGLPAPIGNSDGDESGPQPVNLGWDTSKGPVHGHAVSNIIAGLPPETPEMPGAIPMTGFSAQSPQFPPQPQVIPPPQQPLPPIQGTKEGGEEGGIGTDQMKYSGVRLATSRKKMIAAAIAEVIRGESEGKG